MRRRLTASDPGSPAPTRPDDAGLLDALRACLPTGQVRGSELDRRSWAHDASHFLLQPQAVVSPRDAQEVARLLAVSARQGVPLTFRSGGTSLSGQSVTDGVLVDVRTHFTDVEVLDGGARVRVQPGVTVRRLNARLAPYGTRFGPDPASETACTVGGVLANNASGMACGTTENSYRTLESVVVVLPSGTVVDSGAPDADERLRALEPELHDGLLALRDEVRAQPSWVQRIEAQYAMKNTMGYGLNALLDHDGAAAILAHLVVGSEGTLAFVAEATFVTVPLRRHVATSLLVFDGLEAANRALPALVATGAATLELMDATSLRVGQSFADCPPAIRALTVTGQAALLCEYQSTSAAELAGLTADAAPTLAALGTLTPATLTRDPAVRDPLWKLRKGLYASVAGARPAGTTALLEDVVVPVGSLAPTCVALTRLFETHAYRDSVIFGHAKDGNIHFMLTDRFEGAEPLARYAAFTEEMVDLVLGHGGSLKAEHGTGRVMAPYVRRQFGDDLYAVMRRIKALCDPGGLLNPGVLLDEDPQAHLRHLKLAPAVETEVDRCVECGFCEPVCPSRDLTMTPRRRIAARREIRAAELAGDTGLAARMEAGYDYAGVDTCAVDGLCQTACPVLIDTGDLVRRLRREAQPAVLDGAWTRAAEHWDGFTRAAGLGLSAAGALPQVLGPVVGAANRAARAVVGADALPLWSAELPAGGGRRARPAVPDAAPGTDVVEVVYLPSCVNAVFGPAEGGPGVQVAFETLCARAGVVLHVPDGVDGLCCGTPWSSKGLPGGYAAMQERVVATLREATRGGALPVVTDASSCTEGLVRLLRSGTGGPVVTVLDAMELVAAHVLPRLGDHRRLPSVTVHPTCASTQLGLDATLATLAAAVAEQVHVPTAWGCCAFAGDRGLLHPELTASATAAEAAEVAAVGAGAHVSCNRTCELGMTRATGRTYRHVLEVLAEVSDPAR